MGVLVIYNSITNQPEFSGLKQFMVFCGLTAGQFLLGISVVAVNWQLNVDQLKVQLSWMSEVAYSNGGS